MKMTELLDTIIGRWEYLIWIITGAATIALGLVIVSIKIGGLKIIKSWIVSLEEQRRDAARNRISDGLSQ